MSDLMGYYFEDLEPGMSAAFGKTVTEADVSFFAGVSGDTNPMYLNEEFAAQTLYKTRVAHGMFAAALISAVLGTKLPGPASIQINQSLRFRLPVRIGDTLLARATVKSKLAPKGWVELDTVCTVGDKTVIDGVAPLMVPKRS